MSSLFPKKSWTPSLRARPLLPPEKHLYTQGGELLTPAKPQGIDLGWGLHSGLGCIYGISRSSKASVINHFAIEKSLTGQGLGKQVLVASDSSFALVSETADIAALQLAQPLNKG
ncbi:hypothetical protein [Pseudoxanthomonas sp. Root630]|uniref:hypothetical protein n=1 Tax=Pseudoxanthomonas sp. Root630 TaxID=1736574 RepID=UPI0012DF4756|nr:hypothetical protein [Pseudoxanthomonas sp. Root630]